MRSSSVALRLISKKLSENIAALGSSLSGECVADSGIRRGGETMSLVGEEAGELGMYDGPTQLQGLGGFLNHKISLLQRCFEM